MDDNGAPPSLSMKMSHDPVLKAVLNKRRRENAAAWYCLRHAFPMALLTITFVLVFSRVQGHPVGTDQLADLFVTAIAAAAAGACLAGARLAVKPIRRDFKEEPTTNPGLMTARRQLRFFNWSLLIISAVGFAYLLLIAVSLGCRRPDWITWMPSRRG